MDDDACKRNLQPGLSSHNNPIKELSFMQGRQTSWRDKTDNMTSELGQLTSTPMSQV